MNDKLIENISNSILGLQQAISRLNDLKTAVQSVPAELPETVSEKATVYGSQLDFDNLTHDEVITVVKSFAGKWEKKLSISDPTRIDYSLTTSTGATIRCYQGAPPPNCKLVEYEEEIPAQPARIEKKTKLVCVEAIAPELEPA